MYFLSANDNSRRSITREMERSYRTKEARESGWQIERHEGIEEERRGTDWLLALTYVIALDWQDF